MPLLAAAAAGDGRRSRHGMRFDALGDVAQNDGEEGHATRHFLANRAIYSALRRVYGGQASYEPRDYADYSDHRPDITLLIDGALQVLDVKIFDPIGSRLQDTGERGAYVACGNTHEAAVDVVLGRRERPGEGRFNRRTGAGRVAAKRGDYARAIENGVECVPLLVETFGGFGPELVKVFERAAEWRQNKLTSSEYDETTWAARKWLPFVLQQISVAVQLAMAQEIAEALGLSVAADPRAT